MQAHAMHKDSLSKNKNYLKIGFGILFLFQIGLTIYFNLFKLAGHLGYDSSWAFLRAALMWNEKALYSSNWVEQSVVAWDSSMSLVPILYGITHNIFLSQGVVNLIVLACILVCINDIQKRMGMDVIIRLITMNLVICPYLSNGFYELSYYNDIVVGPTFYAVRALIFLLIIREAVVISQKSKIDLWGYITCLLCILTGMSTGVFMIIVALAPYAVYLLIRAVIKNSYKQLLDKNTLFCGLCILAVFVGELIAKYVLKAYIADAGKTWTQIGSVWKNFGAVFQGLLKLLQVLPLYEKQVMTVDGIYRVFPILLFAVFAACVVIAIRKGIKERQTISDTKMLLITIVIMNLIVFSLFNVQYGADIFEERYLICAFFAMVLLVGFAIRDMDKTKLATKTGAVLLLVLIAIVSGVSDYKYYMTDLSKIWQMDEVKQTVADNEADLVYVWGDNLVVFGRSMRVYDMDHIYKEIGNDGQYHHWGDYLNYENNEDYSGKTLLITEKTTDNGVPKGILRDYTLIRELDNVNIYESDHNPDILKASVADEQ